MEQEVVARLLPELMAALAMGPAGVSGACEKMGGRGAFLFGKSRKPRWFVVDAAELRYYYTEEASRAGRRCAWHPAPGGRYPLAGARLEPIEAGGCASACRLHCPGRGGMTEDFFFADRDTALRFECAVKGAAQLLDETSVANRPFGAAVTALASFGVVAHVKGDPRTHQQPVAPDPTTVRPQPAPVAAAPRHFAAAPSVVAPAPPAAEAARPQAQQPARPPPAARAYPRVVASPVTPTVVPGAGFASAANW